MTSDNQDMPTSSLIPDHADAAVTAGLAETPLAGNALTKALTAAKVLPDANSIAKRVDHIRCASPGCSADELARQVVTSTTRKLTGMGVAASLPGVVPGVGTAVQLAVSGTSITAETWAVLRELAAMQLTVAGLFGHPVTDPERRDELLIVWALETGAIVPVAEAGKRLGQRIAVAQINRHVSGAMLRRLNTRLGAQVFTKFGTKRGSIALGRVAPFGVGVAVGGTMNYATGRSFGKALIRYYADLLPSGAEVLVVD